MPSRTEVFYPDNFNGWWEKSLTVTYRKFKDINNTKIDDASYAQTDGTVGTLGFGAGSFCPGYKLDLKISRNAVIENCYFYTEMRNSNGTLSALSRPYYGAEDGTGVEFIKSEKELGTAGTSFTAKSENITEITREHMKSTVFYACVFNNNRVGSVTQYVRYHYMSVRYRIPATSITLDKSSMVLAPNELAQLIHTVAPLETTDTVTWTSSAPNVATVTGAGLVTALAQGTTTVTTSTESGRSASCVVIVANTYTLMSSVTPAGTGSITPSSGSFTGGTTRTIRFLPDADYIISSYSINGVAYEPEDSRGFALDYVFTQDTVMNMVCEYRAPSVTQTHTRERISDKLGVNESTTTFYSDMAYAEMEIRKTAKDAPRGRGSGELLFQDTTSTEAGVENSRTITYQHLITDGDYVISVYVKNNYGVWSA